MKARGQGFVVSRPQAEGEDERVKRGGREGVEGGVRREILVNDGAEIGHTPAACKTRGEIKCFINVIKAKSCVSNEPR